VGPWQTILELKIQKRKTEKKHVRDQKVKKHSRKEKQKGRDKQRHNEQRRKTRRSSTTFSKGMAENRDKIQKRRKEKRLRAKIENAQQKGKKKKRQAAP
jgi:hypothetical protein